MSWCFDVVLVGRHSIHELFRILLNLLKVASWYLDKKQWHRPKDLPLDFRFRLVKQLYFVDLLQISPEYRLLCKVFDIVPPVLLYDSRRLHASRRLFDLCRQHAIRARNYIRINLVQFLMLCHPIVYEQLIGYLRFQHSVIVPVNNLIELANDVDSTYNSGDNDANVALLENYTIPHLH